MSSFAFLKPKNELYRTAKIAKTKAKILDRLSDLPVEVRKDKMNIEFLLLVCNAVEHCIDNTGKKDKQRIDKKLLVMDIMNSLFGAISPQEANSICANIEYLHDNNQIVKYAFWRVASACLIEWCKKKLA